MNEKVRKSLDGFFDVLEVQDPCDILNIEIPSHSVFIEPLANKIAYSFLTFIDTNKEERYERSSLQNERGKYTTIYDLFHDIKVSCLVKIQEVENNADLYNKVDTFYKVSVEMLLREAISLGVSLKQDRELVAAGLESVEADEVENSCVELEDRLANEFDMITSVFYNATGQALSIFTGSNMPFFTSLNKKKSELDDREPVLDPSLGMNIINVIPNQYTKSNEVMGKLSFSESKLPSHMKKCLDNYIHPNWLRLMDSQWLKHGKGINSLLFSFAPTHDESNSVIYNDWRGCLWAQQVGFEKLVQLKEQYNASVKKEGKVKTNSNENKVVNLEGKEETDKSEIKDQDDQKDDLDEGLHYDEEEEENESLNNLAADISYNPLDKIDIKKLFTFNSRNNATEDDVEAVRANESQKIISKLLLELSELRQARLCKKSKKTAINSDRINKPSHKEVETYQRIRRLITGLIQHKDIKPSELDLEVDSRLPVLQNEYCGTLPANHMNATIEKSNNKYLVGRTKRW